MAADADAPRELVVSTQHATYLVKVQKGKLVPVCQQGLPGGIAVAGGGPVVFGNKAFRQYTEFTPLPAGASPPLGDRLTVVYSLDTAAPAIAATAPAPRAVLVFDPTENLQDRKSVV